MSMSSPSIFSQSLETKQHNSKPYTALPSSGLEITSHTLDLKQAGDNLYKNNESMKQQ